MIVVMENLMKGKLLNHWLVWDWHLILSLLNAFVRLWILGLKIRKLEGMILGWLFMNLLKFSNLIKYLISWWGLLIKKLIKELLKCKELLNLKIFHLLDYNILVLARKNLQKKTPWLLVWNPNLKLINQITVKK